MSQVAAFRENGLGPADVSGCGGLFSISNIPAHSRVRRASRRFSACGANARGAAEFVIEEFAMHARIRLA